MPLMRSLGLALIVALLAGTASAYTVKGHIRCDDILREDGNENYRAMNKWWLLGYFTARNYENGADVGAGIADEDLYGLAIGYCRSNLSADWDDAAIEIYDRLR